MARSCIRVKRRRKCKLSLQNIKLYIFMFDGRVLLTVVSLVVGGVWLDRSNIITCLPLRWLRSWQLPSDGFVLQKETSNAS